MSERAAPVMAHPFAVTGETMFYYISRTFSLVFCSPAAEFGGEPRSHYENAIRGGLLTVNGEKVGLDYRLQNSDLICNRQVND